MSPFTWNRQRTLLFELLNVCIVSAGMATLALPRRISFERVSLRSSILVKTDLSVDVDVPRRYVASSRPSKEIVKLRIRSTLPDISHSTSTDSPSAADELLTRRIGRGLKSARKL